MQYYVATVCLKTIHGPGSIHKKFNPEKAYDENIT